MFVHSDDAKCPVSPRVCVLYRRQWLRAVSALVSDKTLDLRRAAAEAVRAVYRADPACVELYVRHSSGAEGVGCMHTQTRTHTTQHRRHSPTYFLLLIAEGW